MKRGFTLVELLSVIVILAIILAIAIPTISNIINGSKKNSFEASAKLILKTVRLKLLENSSFDLTLINKNSLESLLNIDSENYSQVYVRKDNDGKLYTTINGTGQWENLTAIGSLENMSTKTTEQIVTNGLVSYLDAGNLASYHGAGTSWYDISGNNNNATLMNGVSFNTNSGGGLYFDGINDYVSTTITPANLGLNFSGSFVAKTSGSLSFTTPDISYRLMTARKGAGSTLYAIGISETRILKAMIFNGTSHYYFGTTTIQPDTYYNIAFTYQPGTFKIYLNGALDTTASITIPATYYDYIMIGDLDLVTRRIWKGDINNAMFYNRTLSDQEIQQNYNALKARFGI